MFALPSMWNLIISAIVFFVSAWYIHRYLNEQGIPNGMTRGILVFMLASLVSWGAGEIVEWTQEKTEGPSPVVRVPDVLPQSLKEAERP